MKMSDEYKTSCEDELDWKDVDQLHQAILQISKSCFEYKKLCVGFFGIAIALVVKFTENPLNHAVFSIGLLICVGFWISDATAYYFQKRLRNQLEDRRFAIAERNNCTTYTRQSIEVSRWKALLNWSMVLYHVLIAIGLMMWLCYEFGVFGK